MTIGIFEIWKPRPEWYALSDEEKRDFISQFPSFFKAVAEKGAVDIAKGSYLCRLGSEWETFSLTEVSDYESAAYYAEVGDALGWHQYFDHLFIVGHKVSQLEFDQHLMKSRGQLQKHQNYVAKERLG